MKEKEWEAWKACIPGASHQVMDGIIRMDIMRPPPLTGGKQNKDEDFPAAQWLRVHLPPQGTQFNPLSGKTPHAVGQSSQEPQLRSLCSRAHAPQQKSLQ